MGRRAVGAEPTNTRKTEALGSEWHEWHEWHEYMLTLDDSQAQKVDIGYSCEAASVKVGCGRDVWLTDGIAGRGYSLHMRTLFLGYRGSILL